MLHATWKWLIKWTERMARTYGGTVYENDGTTWDWGQAIAREMYGPDWMDHPDFIAVDEMWPEEPPPDEVVQRARDWEHGEWPAWVDRQAKWGPAKKVDPLRAQAAAVVARGDEEAT